MFKFSWINKNLSVGSAFQMEDASKLKQMGIDAIIEIRSENHDDQELIERLGMQYLHVAVEDRYAPTKEQIKTIFRFALPLLNCNKKIFVHCQNGYGRSPLVVISILIEQGMSVGDALQLVKDRHSDLAFTPQQERFISELIEMDDGIY